MERCEEKAYMFFSHKTCECFPCHTGVKEEEFNCLFCYCPLYALGKDCGGNFTVMENGCKNCSDCTIPHRKENYHYIISKYEEIAELVKKNL